MSAKIADLIGTLLKIQHWNEKAHDSMLSTRDVVKEGIEFNLDAVHFLFASTAKNHQIIGIVAAERSDPAHAMFLFIDTPDNKTRKSTAMARPFLSMEKTGCSLKKNKLTPDAFPLCTVEHAYYVYGVEHGFYRGNEFKKMEEIWKSVCGYGSDFGVHKPIWDLYVNKGGPPLDQTSSRCFCKEACSSLQGWFGKGFNSCQIYDRRETAKVDKDCLPQEYESNQRRGGLWKRCGKYSQNGSSIQEQVIHHLNHTFRDKKKWSIGGYSDGGALAVLCATHLALVIGSDRLQEVILLGAPRIGNDAFVKLYENDDLLGLKKKTKRVEIREPES